MNTTTHNPLESCPECGNTWLTLKADNGRVDSATCDACRYHWHVGVNVAAAPELLDFSRAVARSACLDQRVGDKCVCFSCEAKRLIDKAESR